MRPRSEKRGRRGFWGRAAVCNAIGIVFVLACLLDARAQQSQPTPSESPAEAEVEPSPIPGTEILLEPQLPPLPGKTLKLGPPGVVEPILPPVNFEALARSGRLWSFHGVVKEFRFVGNHVFSSASLAKVLSKLARI
jgi:hypothetical protein